MLRCSYGIVFVRGKNQEEDRFRYEVFVGSLLECMVGSTTDLWKLRRRVALVGTRIRFTLWNSDAEIDNFLENPFWFDLNFEDLKWRGTSADHMVNCLVTIRRSRSRDLSMTELPIHEVLKSFYEWLHFRETIINNLHRTRFLNYSCSRELTTLSLSSHHDEVHSRFLVDILEWGYKPAFPLLIYDPSSHSWTKALWWRLHLCSELDKSYMMSPSSFCLDANATTLFTGLGHSLGIFVAYDLKPQFYFPFYM